jgi:hypothetical protein
MTYFKVENRIVIMEDYEKLLSAILESQKEFVGEEQALSAARKSSLQLTSDGEIEDFYGQGPVAAKVLIQVFYRQTGQAGLNYAKRYLHSRGMEIPEEVETPSREKDLLEKMLEKARSLRG